MLQLTAAGLACAQSAGLALEEVIVSATRSEELLSDVAVSVVAIGKEELEAQGLRSLDTVAAGVPNVVVQRSYFGGAYLVVRGAGSPIMNQVQSTVGTFIDGVYIPNARNALTPLFDMERVELLRGPQGTLFGKNSIAGVFNVVTARPSDMWEGLVDARIGNERSHEVTGMISGPLNDSLNGRLAAFNRKTGNWLDNDLGPGAGGQDTEAYRASMTWQPSDDTQVWLKWEHFNDVFNGAMSQVISIDPADAAVFAGADTRLDKRMVLGTGSRFGADFGLSPEAYSSSSADLLTLSVDHQFADGYLLSLVYGDSLFRTWARGNIVDSPTVNIFLDSGLDFTTRNLELKLSSPQDRSLRFSTGVYLEKSRKDLPSSSIAQGNFETLGPVLNSILASTGLPAALLGSNTALAPALQIITHNSNRARGTALSPFFEATYEFNDEWTAIVGLRLARDRIKVDKSFEKTDSNGNVFASLAAFGAVLPMGGVELFPGYTVATAYSDVAGAVFGTFVNPSDTPPERLRRTDRVTLPAAKLEYRPSPDALYYFSVQTGYKNGGFNIDSYVDSVEFEPEESLAFELGAKYSLADGRGQLNVALFQTGFDDLQVAVLNPTNGSILIRNAAEATVRGIEWDARWQLTENLVVGGAYGYLDAQYDSYANGDCTIDQKLASAGATCAQDLGGRPLPQAPRNTASAFVQYTRPVVAGLEFSAALDVSYRDEAYGESTLDWRLAAERQTLVNARLALSHLEQQWTVALIGNNLTDDDARLSGGTNGALQGPLTYYAPRQPPTSYWLQIQKRFGG